MKKTAVATLNWLIGGSIGVILGLIFSLYLIARLDLPDPDLYSAVYHISAIIIVISVFLGGVFGTILSKIVALLKEIYIKK